MDETTPRYTDHYPLSQVLIRFFIGFASGFIGTIILAIIMLATWSVIGGYLTAESANSINDLSSNGEGLNPIFVVIVGMSIFFTTMISNIIYSILVPLVDEKYQAKSIALSTIFTGGLVLAGMMIPVYIVSSATIQETGVGVSALMHASLFSIYTMLIMEIVNKNNYLIVTVLGVVLGMVLFTISSLLLFSKSDNNSAVVILLTYPLLMGCMSMANTLIEGIYGWFYKTYGTDTLAGK